LRLPTGRGVPPGPGAAGKQPYRRALVPCSHKQSGWGREMGHEVLNNYTEVKAVTALL